MVTKVAIMIMKQEIRTCFGIRLRNVDTRKLDPTSTKNVAMPIARALMAELVTASIGHIPSTWTNTGLSRQMPLISSSYDGFFFIRPPRSPARIPPPATDQPMPRSLR